MNICALLVLVYLVGSAGIVIMKKLQPEDKIYPVWVAAICVYSYMLCSMVRILGAILFNPEIC